MKTNKIYRIEKCVSDDITREAMTHIHADKENECLVATNSHIMAVVPAEFDETDTTGFISTNAYKAGIKAMPKKIDELMMSVNGTQKLFDGTEIPRPNESAGRYPNYQSVIPTMDNTEPQYQIAFSADYLKRLADAIGTDNVVLTIFGVNKAIRVEPTTDDNKAYGVLMPVRINNEKREEFENAKKHHQVIRDIAENTVLENGEYNSAVSNRDKARELRESLKSMRQSNV